MNSAVQVAGRSESGVASQGRKTVKERYLADLRQELAFLESGREELKALIAAVLRGGVPLLKPSRPYVYRGAWVTFANQKVAEGMTRKEAGILWKELQTAKRADGLPPVTSDP